MAKNKSGKSVTIGVRARKQIERGFDFKFVRELLKQFPKSDVYVVGGTVRDALIGGRDSKDYDLVVSGVAAKTLAAFLKKYGTVNLVGRNFGVYKFLPANWDPKNAVDIALPRKEFSLGTGGYRDFDVQSDANLPIEADLARRDFTWNAMAWSARQKTLIDPWNGIGDLKNKVLRTVGNPAERFSEDYTRILRAIRFALVLDFKIEDATLRAIKKLIPRLADERVLDGKRERVTPYEMISEEFLKALMANPVKTMEMYRALGALKVLMPELLKMDGCEQPKEYHAEGDVWAHTMLALQNLEKKTLLNKVGLEKPDAELVLAVVFHDIGKPYKRKFLSEAGKKRVVFYEHDEEGARRWREVAERLKFSAVPDFNVSVERIAWLIRNHLVTWNNNPYQMRETTLEKYFFNPKYSGDNLMALTFADAMATRPNGKAPDLKNLSRFMKKIGEMKKMASGKKVLPPPVLDGTAIMKILGLKPGPKIGEIINLLREEQLSGRVNNKKQAENFLKNKIS